MNGIEKITQRISEDARAEADSILTQAKAEAKAITAQWEAQARAEAGELLAQGEKTAAEQTERQVRTAEMEGKRLVLSTKQALLSRAFDEALKSMLALPEAQRVDLLASLCAKAAVSGQEEVIFSPEDQQTVGKAVVDKANQSLSGGKLTLSRETRPIQGGFILSDQGVEVNCAFDTLIRLARPQLERQVADLLFEEA